MRSKRGRQERETTNCSNKTACLFYLSLAFNSPPATCLTSTAARPALGWGSCRPPVLLPRPLLVCPARLPSCPRPLIVLLYPPIVLHRTLPVPSREAVPVVPPRSLLLCPAPPVIPLYLLAVPPHCATPSAGCAAPPTGCCPFASCMTRLPVMCPARWSYRLPHAGHVALLAGCISHPPVVCPVRWSYRPCPPFATPCPRIVPLHSPVLLLIFLAWQQFQHDTEKSRHWWWRRAEGQGQQNVLPLAHHLRRKSLSSTWTNASRQTWRLWGGVFWQVFVWEKEHGLAT